MTAIFAKAGKPSNPFICKMLAAKISRRSLQSRRTRAMPILYQLTTAQTLGDALCDGASVEPVAVARGVSHGTEVISTDGTDLSGDAPVDEM